MSTSDTSQWDLAITQDGHELARATVGDSGSIGPVAITPGAGVLLHRRGLFTSWAREKAGIAPGPFVAAQAELALKDLNEVYHCRNRSRVARETTFEFTDQWGQIGYERPYAFAASISRLLRQRSTSKHRHREHW